MSWGCKMKWLQAIKLVVETLCSLSILIAAVIACTTFKFKLGVDERKLYLDNANKVREVLGFVYREGNIDDANLCKIGIAFEEASLYLNKDIVDFIDEIRKSLIRLYCIRLELKDLPVGEKRSKLCDEMGTILIKLGDYSKESIIIYRKHIVSEPLEVFYKVKKKLNDFKKENIQGINSGRKK